MKRERKTWDQTTTKHPLDFIPKFTRPAHKKHTNSKKPYRLNNQHIFYNRTIHEDYCIILIQQKECLAVESKYLRQLNNTKTGYYIQQLSPLDSQRNSPIRIVNPTIHISQLDRGGVPRHPRSHGIFGHPHSGHFLVRTLGSEPLHRADFPTLLARAPPLPIRVPAIRADMNAPALPLPLNAAPSTTASYHVSIDSATDFRNRLLFSLCTTGFGLLGAVTFSLGDETASGGVVNSLNGGSLLVNGRRRRRRRRFGESRPAV